MKLSLPIIQRLYRTGLWVVIILILLDLLTYFYYPDTPLSEIFLATREQTPLTWVSSLTFLFIALSSFSAYFETKRKIWYFLSIVFFFFSMDDAVYFHERLSGFFVNETGLFSFFPSYTWVIIYLPLLGFSLGALIYLLWHDVAKNKRKKAVIVALLMLGFAVLLDLSDGLIQKNSSITFCFNSSCNLVVTHLMRLTEEVLEVFALGLLGYINIKKHYIEAGDTT
ncbi:MAG: hypothetical protein R6V40_01390 [Candidatus Moraniibacteriota bacterium]